MLFGDRVRVLLSSLEDWSPVAMTLEQAGLKLQSVRQVEPSLEDVFTYQLKDGSVDA